MISMEWIQVYAPGFQALSTEERKSIMNFLFLWSFFESEALNRRGGVRVLVAVAQWWADNDLLTERTFEPFLEYCRNRYYRDGAFTYHFDHLNLRDGDRPNLVRRVLANDTAEYSDIVAALLIIVYRFRNNLFHGEKWAYQLRGQLENFNQANAILMHSIELNRHMPRPE